MQKEDDKVGNITANKEGKEAEIRERGRKIEIDSQKIKIKISPNQGFCAAWKTKKLFDYIRLDGK